MELKEEPKKNAAPDEGVQLDDDKMEEVSGGVGARQETDYCVYCHNDHTLEKFSPWPLTFSGKSIINATRCNCSVMNKIFFSVPVPGGVEYYDDRKQRIN